MIPEAATVAGDGKESSGRARRVRQILIARPGQQPSQWLDFETLQRMLLKWQGYAIIGICRQLPLLTDLSESESE